MQYQPLINKNRAVEELVRKENLFQRKKDLCRSELIFLPYYLFAVTIHSNDGKSRLSHVCVDMINGECAYLVNNNFNNIVNVNNFIPDVTENEAGDKARKFIINEILYKKRKYQDCPQIEIELKNIMEYPYWIGYFKKENGYDFNIIDGVTGQRQGPKMKAVFIKYLIKWK